jgi:hypothetical protein
MIGNWIIMKYNLLITVLKLKLLENQIENNQKS